MYTLNRCKPLLGTFVEVSLESDVSADDLIDHSIAAFNAVEAVHNAMSFHLESSELSVINREACHHPCELSASMKTVLDQAMQLSQLSDGLFDISVAGRLVAAGALPDVGLKVDAEASWKDIEINGNTIQFHRPLLIDLGGIAKGYAVDCAIKAVDSQIKTVVNAGGDLRMSHWQNQTVGIQSPSVLNQVFEMPMHAAALATSGCYFLEQQDSVIYPPNQSQPVVSQGSFSVFADSCMLADGLTKIAFLDSDVANDVAHHLAAQAWFIDHHNVLTRL